ncbi:MULTISPECIES: AI-2E family transporter [Haloferax]|uniref:AI-2E family transporter n=1 Tax=Haloferax marinum TaxID=2666143 RepID=A0A6A8GAT3_9EURY|nr:MULTISPECIES: AI-2E family transporter [Haloferax]KAB1198612.1 AI-2E family transporter [Haloferax sp. CBA1150]MRW97722.1 AI-2E family transporter [Haloferax marinum]
MAVRRVGEAAVGNLRSPRIWWGALGLLLLGVLAWVGFRYLGWVVFGLFTYYVGRPITRRLLRHISSRSMVAGLTLTFIIVPILLFILLFLGVATNQALQILSSDLTTAVLDRLRLPIESLPSDPVELLVVVLSDPSYSSLVEQFGGFVGVFATTLFNVFLTLIFAFFLLVEDVRLSRWFEDNIFGADSLAVDYFRSVDKGLTSVYFGYTLTIFVVIILAAIIYSAFNFFAPPGIRIPYAILLAVVTGVFTLIPLVGRSVVYAFIVGILSLEALSIDAQLLWIPAVFFVSMVLVFDNVVRTYIRPYLSGKSYHMALVMFAYLLGPVLFGWYGIFLGPLLMVFTVEFITKIMPRLVNDGSDQIDEAIPEVGTGGGSSVEFGDSPDRGETPTG